MIRLTDKYYARFKIIFGGADAVRPPLEIEADDFVGIKSFKAKGKRLTTYEVAEIDELEPTREPEPKEEIQEHTVEDAEPETEDVPDKPKAVQGDLFGDELS